MNIRIKFFENYWIALFAAFVNKKNCSAASLSRHSNKKKLVIFISQTQQFSSRYSLELKLCGMSRDLKIYSLKGSEMNEWMSRAWTHDNYGKNFISKCLNVTFTSAKGPHRSILSIKKSLIKLLLRQTDDAIIKNPYDLPWECIRM